MNLLETPVAKVNHLKSIFSALGETSETAPRPPKKSPKPQFLGPKETSPPPLDSLIPGSFPTRIIRRTSLQHAHPSLLLQRLLHLLVAFKDALQDGLKPCALIGELEDVAGETRLNCSGDVVVWVHKVSQRHVLGFVPSTIRGQEGINQQLVLIGIRFAIGWDVESCFGIDAIGRARV